MGYRVTLLPGDGIGPEIIAAAQQVLTAVETRFGLGIETACYPFGGAAIDECGAPLPEATLMACIESDAVLLGAVGGPKWDHLPSGQRPESGLLGLRQGMGVFANLRPATLHPALAHACPLRPERVAGGLDLLVVRELTGGIYFGERGRRPAADGTESAFDVEAYSEAEVRRIAHRAFEQARIRGQRRGNMVGRPKVTSVDKANVLESSRLWRQVVCEVATEYPEVTLEHLYVDNAAMQLILNPQQFDVLLTGNLFGDILSDEASVLAGAIGLLPSASLSEGTLGLYEPIHGSAPDLAGKDVANPIGTILSLELLLALSLKERAAADAVAAAVSEVLAQGWRTADLCDPGEKPIGTAEMGRRIAEALLYAE